MIKLGVGVASKAKSPFDKQLEGLLGEATSKGTQAAIKTANGGVKDGRDDAPLREAALEAAARTRLAPSFASDTVQQLLA
jgi:hypothetical protein